MSEPTLAVIALTAPTFPGFTPNTMGLEIAALDRPGEVGGGAALFAVVANRS